MNGVRSEYGPHGRKYEFAVTRKSISEMASKRQRSINSRAVDTSHGRRSWYPRVARRASRPKVTVVVSESCNGQHAKELGRGCLVNPELD